MRTGRCFGVVLHTEDRPLLVPDPFDRVVVEIQMGHFDVVGQRIGRQREAMVLRRDLDLAGPLVEHRLIGTTVSELQLEDLASQRQPQQLYAQTDPEDRLLLNQLLNRPDRVVQRPRISGTVRQKDSVRIVSKDVFG